MSHIVRLSLIIMLIPLGSVFGSEVADPGRNAALKYWQAFATLPKFSDAENKKIGECLSTPLDEETRKLLARAEYSLNMMHRGAAIRNCYWGMSFSEDGVYALLPHASASRVLANLACLRGRLRFEAGQNAVAVDDFLAAITLGRHVSQDGSLLTILVGYSIENKLCEALAINLPKLDPGSIKAITTRMTTLPAFGKPSAGLLYCEKETIDWFIRKVGESRDPENLLIFLNWVGISEGKNQNLNEKAHAFLKDCGGNAEGVIKYAKETIPSYDSMAKALDLPLKEFEKEFQKESARQAGNPVYKVFFPALANMTKSRARADIRRALFSAALAIQLEGKEKLKDFTDPVTGGPLEYKPFETGFELRSQWTGQDNKPLTLTVGRKK